MDEMIDRQSPIPMYIQIEEGLKRQIIEGKFSVGAVIPSERELTELFNVSRMTIRQAVNNLVTSGWLYREKGKGTFVAALKVEQPLNKMTSFTEDMKARGLMPSNQVIGLKKMKPPQEIAEKLSLKLDEDVFFVERVRFANKEPMAIERTYLPVKLFNRLTEEDLEGSLYYKIEQDPFLSISHASQQIEASLVKEEDAELLEIEMPCAILRIERISYLTNGMPFEAVHSTYRADRYKFITEIHRN